MNETPQTTREDEQDLLEQIITQGLDQMKSPEWARTGPDAPSSETPPAPKQENGEKAAPPAEKKNRRSSVYLYLLVLFGAAFLMLLLAYFVQQRNSEDTISDLRDSMNLSRQELLDEIKELEEQNAALDEKIDLLNDDLSQWQTRYEEKKEEIADLRNQIRDITDERHSWESFWALEETYRAKNYVKCAHILLVQKQSQIFTYQTPAVVQERYDEIVQAIIDEGILDEDYAEHLDDYSELLELVW